MFAGGSFKLSCILYKPTHGFLRADHYAMFNINQLK